jgi:ATP-dependent Clp protease protease subunit
MIHQPEGGSQGQATVVLSESEEVLRIRDEVAQIYADRTAKQFNVLHEI